MGNITKGVLKFTAITSGIVVVLIILLLAGKKRGWWLASPVATSNTLWYVAIFLTFATVCLVFYLYSRGGAIIEQKKWLDVSKALGAFDQWMFNEGIIGGVATTEGKIIRLVPNAREWGS